MTWDMTWILALSQGMSCPLCQMFAVVCMGMCAPEVKVNYSGVWDGEHGRMKSDVRPSFRESCRAGELSVCAVLRAGVEFDLLSGGSVCGVADVSGGDGGVGCQAAEGDGVEGFADGAGGVERVRGCGAVHLPDVRDYAAGVRDCGWDHPAADRAGYARGEAVSDAGVERRGERGGEQGRCGDRSAGHTDAGRAGVDYERDGAGGAGADAVADGGDPGFDRDHGGDLLSGAGELGPGGEGDGGDGCAHPGAHHGVAAGGAGGAVLRERHGGPGRDREAVEDWAGGDFGWGSGLCWSGI